MIPKGFKLAAVHCGIKKKKLDLGLILADGYAKCVGTFTTNINCAYSVTFCKKNVNNLIRAVLVNSGNANCFSHKSGLKDTVSLAKVTANSLGVKQGNILICSTGIIGERLPVNKIKTSLTKLKKNLSKDIKKFATSIMTTDTFAKVSSAKAGKAIITGVAKGAGMIAPNMATMLAFVLTDAKLPSSVLKSATKEAVSDSFNSISVDGCMSTNDTVLVLSSGKVELKTKKEQGLFAKKLKSVCIDLAKMIVKDGEGVSKFIEINIAGAKSPCEAKKAAKSLADSALFKCAIYGADANWGRIIQALGQAGIKVSEKISIKSSSLKKKDVKINIDLKRGKHKTAFYTTDLTPKYVKLNAEYS